MAEHVAILIARIVSVADPSVAELGGSYLSAGAAGVAAVANLDDRGRRALGNEPCVRRVRHQGCPPPEQPPVGLGARRAVPLMILK
jgi:hypothetical protein